MNISKELNELSRRLNQTLDDYTAEENDRHHINLSADTAKAYRTGHAIAKLNDILYYIALMETAL